MHNFIFLPTNINEDYLQTLKKIAYKNDRFCPHGPIVILFGNFPCQAFFLDSKLYLCFDKIEIDTGLTRKDFEKEEEEEGFIDYEVFYVMLSEEKLKGLGIEVKPGEGWKWDADKLRSIKVERSEGPNQAWCPATEEWEKHCDCEYCKKKPTNSYVQFSVIKSIYNELPSHLKFDIEVGNPLAVFANRCPWDNINYCEECGNCFDCEKTCSVYRDNQDY